MAEEEAMDVDAGKEFNEFDDLLEEGEYVEPNRVHRKVLSTVVALPLVSRHENKSRTFVTGIDVFSEEAKVKKEERAKRFGIKDSDKNDACESENLYDSFGIVRGSEDEKNYRLNVIHMRGTENLGTKDIFKYFEDYAPASIEWINDVSCNVVWLDRETAGRALLGLSRKIIGTKKESRNKQNSEDESEEVSDDDGIVNGKNSSDKNVIHVRDIRCSLPPGIWRKGRDYKDSRNIFLRFATRSDKKPSSVERMGLKGIMSTSRKRSYREMKAKSPSPEKGSDTNGVSAKNPWGSLSKNWGRADFVEEDYLPKRKIEPVSSNIKRRLGWKPLERDDTTENDSNVIELSDESESETSSEEESWNRRSKIPRMRMHADDEEEKIQKRKGKIRTMIGNSLEDEFDESIEEIPDRDLRKRLSARRRLPPVHQEEIQVVVSNPKAIRSDFSNLSVTEDEEEDDVQEGLQQDDDDEEEEGEIIDDSESDSKVEYEDEEDELDESQSVSESDSDSSSSSISEKEVQGPRGSVIKVVQPKPRLQSTISTVWTRLNHSKKDKDDRSSEERYSKKDLRHALKKTDLRSRIGNNHKRGRSPLRIELRNDKYSGRQSDSE